MSFVAHAMFGVDWFPWRLVTDAAMSSYLMLFILSVSGIAQ